MLSAESAVPFKFVGESGFSWLGGSGNGSDDPQPVMTSRYKTTTKKAKNLAPNLFPILPPGGELQLI